MTILYLHGMASSHESDTARYLKEFLPEHQVIVPDLYIDPKCSFRIIDDILQSQQVDLMIGHSLGGFMAQKYHDRPKILLNPCLGTSFFRLFVGKNKYKHERYDGINTWIVTKELCKTYKSLENSQFDNISQREKQITYGVFARHDLYTRWACRLFTKHYEHRIDIPGRHFLTRATVRDYLVPLVREFEAYIL